MEGEPDAVTADLFHDGVAVFPGVGVDRVSDIAQVSPRSGGGEPQLHTFFSHADEALGAFGNLSHLEHTGSVREISVKDG